MKAVVQRVKWAKLSVEGLLISEIGQGFAVYLGVAEGDDEKDLDYIVGKVSRMRIFEDENGKMNLALKDIGGEILLISQFTLLADCSHGNRPSFIGAEKPDKAKFIYEKAIDALREQGITVKTGVFGADMKIEQFNDGPVTIIIESPKE